MRPGRVGDGVDVSIASIRRSAKRRGKVFLLYGNAAAVPAVAEIGQAFLDNVEADSFGRKERKGLRQELFGPMFVEVEAGIYPGLAHAGDRIALAQQRSRGNRRHLPAHFRRPLRTRGHGCCQGIKPVGLQAVPELDGAADTHAFVLAHEQPLERVDVVLRVEPVPAVGALGGGHAVASFPRPQRVRLQSGLAHNSFQIIRRCLVAHACPKTCTGAGPYRDGTMLNNARRSYA